MRVGSCRIHWSQALDVIDEIDTTLVMLGEDIGKAKTPSPLTRSGFDNWVKLFTRRVMAAARTGDATAVSNMVRALDHDWTKLTPERREHLITAATDHINLRVRDRFKIQRTIHKTMKDAVAATKRAAKGQLDVAFSASFDGIDQRVVDHVRDSHAHFIRDAYGVRREALSAKARKIVSRGIDAGFDSATIGAELSTQMLHAGVLRAESYWETVSSIYMSRARSYGLARSYTEAGIERVRFEAVGDERTTEICTFMHGKIIAVSEVMSQYQRVAEAADPMDMKDIQPFMREGYDKKGNRLLYFVQNGKTHPVATVLSSGTGVVDGKGSYVQHMSDRKLVQSGCGAPPLHGRCRSTTVPA